MNREIIFGIAGLVALTMVITTGAIPSFGSDEIPDAELSLQPADGPNGVFAAINEDDEIELVLTENNPHTDIDGVQNNTVTTLDRVFTVTYTGDLYSRVWISDEIEAVHFYNETSPADRIDTRENSVVLAPNESVRVGLFVNTRGNHDVASIEDFTIHAETAEPEAAQEDEGEIRDKRTETPSRTRTAAETSTPTEGETPTDANGSIPTDGDTGPGGAVPPENTRTSTDAASSTGEGRAGLIIEGSMAGLVILVILALALTTGRRVQQRRSK